MAGDDLTTGIVGLGAVFVLAGLVSHSRGSLTLEGRPLFRDPLFLAVVFAFGETYTLAAATYTTPYVGQVYTAVPLASVFLDLAVFGGVLIAKGGVLSAYFFRRQPNPKTVG